MTPPLEKHNSVICLNFGSGFYSAHWASTGGHIAYFKKTKYFFFLNFSCFILFFNIIFQIKLDSEEAPSC